MKYLGRVLILTFCLTLVLGAASCAIIKDNVAPGTPTITKVTPDNDHTPTFQWSATDDDTGIDRYMINMDSGWLWINVGDVTTYTWNLALSDGSHSLQVKAIDKAGNIGSIGSLTFICDTTPPILSSIGVSDITTSRATISWTTNEASTSLVEYCLTHSFDSAASSPLDESVVTTHSVILTGLAPATYYYYLVKSKDGSGNESSSLQTYGSFITAPQQNLEVGQAAWNAHQRITVESAVLTDHYSYQDPSLGLVTEHAPTGKTFVFIDVLVENTGTQILLPSESTFSMSDSQGFAYNFSPYSGNDAFNPVSLYTGQKTGGKILFEVPITATGLVLAYDFGDSIIGPVLATWIIVS